ncbi:MAG: sugar phosphate isomerase/epimerase family protein [Candidatus Solibacter sp.]
MQDLLLSRRSLLAAGTLLFAGPAGARPKQKVAIFSKHLQFLQGEELAQGAADLGFDAVDLALRRGGHVEPATVARDLPPLVAAIRKHGLEVSMITTDIVDADTANAEEVLKTASALGIHHYRFGGFRWAANQPLEAQMDGFRPRLAKLAALNQRLGMAAMYHTHSGPGLVGASIWDLYLLMRDLDPKWMGINYDIGHATVEGGSGGWIASWRIAAKHARGIAVKDFLWEKNAAGVWNDNFKPIGDGMVKLGQFFGMVAASDFDGPLQIHYEYPLGGANNGATKLTMPKDEVFAAMKKDLGKVRGLLAQAGL